MRDLFEKMSCFSPIHSGFPEAVTRKCSVKKVFLEILQNSQENTCTRVSFLVKRRLGHNVFSCELCEISKNTYSYRTPPVAASVVGYENKKFRGLFWTLSNIFL